ncbi:unnamed protein product [Cylicostephanus goldi]|uniref:SH3 domain-containing protein n=1 Tax=Cylicostephanus goldi TaxID=71465 RepID=A0A3P6Q1A3_CYLGO|nr:unnamed protein product [Cylicostephanus goldi]
MMKWIMRDQETPVWPSLGERPALRKLGSVSCEVLAWSDDEEDMHILHTDETKPYVNLPRLPLHSASPSTDSEYDFCKKSARKSSEVPSTELESETDATTDNEVTFRDREQSTSDREAEPGLVFEILYNYEAQKSDELNLKAGSTVKLIRKTEEQSWYYGELEDGTRGLYPGNYVRLLGSDAKSISAEEITEPPTGKELIGRGACAEVYKVVFEGEVACSGPLFPQSSLQDV